MQQSSRRNGIISYAGLSKNTLYALARQAFAQANFDVPERFSALLPLFPIELIQNMDYIGSKNQANARVAPSGFSIDPCEYHRKLSAQMPELYEGDNFRRNHDYEGRYQGRGVFTVDKAWAARFPQYQPFMGEKLMIHMLGGGHQAVAVPESLYPRGMGILAAIERRMQVTQSAEQFVQYARRRFEAGEEYHAEAFGADYLAQTGLEAVTITQSELGRVLQDISLAKSLQQENPSAGLFTESAKRVEHLRQYVPYHYASDVFESASVTRHTARLCQPCFLGTDFISDLWIPYQDINSYIDKQSMALDMARLCEGYQISPAYDPETGGGLYPNSLLVIIVRDREIPVMISDVLNNPAYGSGMSPQGMIGRQVFIHDSRELLRQRKLMPEETELVAENTTLSPDAYQRGLVLASLQETKGQLIDAMYRREAALSQMVEGSQPYERAKALLDEKAEALQKGLEALSAAWKHNQVSGYDADISYLHRKALSREGMPDGEWEPIAFAPDPLREQSIEAGYAMRNGIVRMRYTDMYVAPMEEPPREEPQQEALDAPKAPEMDQPRREAPEAGETEIEASKTEQPMGETESPEAGQIEMEPTKAGARQPETGQREAEQPMAETEPPEAEPVEAMEPKIEQPKAIRRHYGFDDIAPQEPKANKPAAPKLAGIVRPDREPAKPVNKGGKMAALVKKRPKN